MPVKSSGEAIVLINRENMGLHGPWAAAAAVGAFAALLWYFVFALLVPSSRWPGGSSPPGLVCGVAGGTIIVFELLLWPRKMLRRFRWGKTRVWMAAHVWLGLLCVPLIVLHSGFRWGGLLTETLVVLFSLVIASGVFGLWLQQWLPRMMTELVPSETVYSQIDAVASRLSADAEQLVAATCGVAGRDDRHTHTFSGGSRAESRPAAPTDHMIVGRPREVGNIEGAVVQTIAPLSPVPGSEALSIAYQKTIKGFLRHGSRGNSAILKDRNRAHYFFQELRSQLAPETHAVVETLQRWCELRRQFDVQSRLHHWLHLWMGVHLHLSVALVLLMLLHIYGALKYWY